jgi:SPP1 gp7 family putative phage head morphogenesis protein
MPVNLVRTQKAEADPVLAAAASMEPKVRDAFLRAVEIVRGRIEMDKLIEALRSGNADAALAVLALDKNFAAALQGSGLEAGIQSFRDAVRDAYASGAREAIDQLPRSVSTELSFDMLSRQSLDFLASYEFSLIRDLTEQSKEAIRQVLVRAFEVGGHPREQAREIREVIGLTGRQEAAVENFRRALSSNDTLRGALSRSLRDGRYDRTLLSALNSGRGLSQEQIEKMTTRYRERYLKYRAETIARTETIRAAMRGQREAWRQAEEQGLFGSKRVLRMWIASGDEATCEQCNSLDGETAGLDEEFEPGVMEPPDTHPSCRCTVTLEFK